MPVEHREPELAGAVEVRTPGVIAAGVLLAVAVVLTALNLRPAITGVGPMLAEMRSDLGASVVWAGVLTTLPTLCFAGAGLAAPLLARRAGIGAAIAVALAALAGGLVLRVLDGPAVVLGGTLVATAGIALINVLIPVVIKDSFPARIGLLTGVYTAALQGGGALGSAVTPRLGDALGGWRPALGGWAVLAVVALLAWILAARGTGRAPRPADGAEGGRSLLRNRLAWIVTAFFGLQAFYAYAAMGWFPQVLMDAGVRRDDAGLLFGLVSLIAVPISLFVAPMAARQRGQSRWIVGLGLFGVAGTAGLMLAPSWSPLLWSILVGLGMSTFSLALTVIALRARTGADTARLSGMAQGFGYLFAALGPFLFGLLHDLAGGWTVPLAMLLGLLAVQLTFGALAGRHRFV
ncbi:MFS transporter CP family, cyanate transporter [Amycolatopsis mediterranei S699]|uniref:MFS transporter, CP family, cyanate transporter n=2 Tax=Amycolatopsis mediterranei TaxID=33910 RepID=A0A0H3D0Z8_AMYMU|nr:MFS transporter [Amycolatopsis mediterranei]ADJ43859.1 MFS transporter, CP family, cyanate transporter [Amycolatopsis mediterranei U32]AEK40573.1 MFS transporter CP family, cyanate transporter [Amycolatopsis mediterranei S699]AFO75572.1 MFS transporter CP family, cyanate transporter [Amycolatopsis mediterranei S699]AGT82701.1 MFS transporter CP family, cyanate transporter [Amycolatopsis mediterranei RB]KDO09135.1 major facilitator transporter [Amycolatopsis mediterranei]